VKAENAKWADEGSTAKEKRAAEKEAKRLDDLAKKQKKAELVAKEEADSSKKQKPAKLTREKILSLQEKAAAEAAQQREVEEMKRSNIVPQIELTDNENQRARDMHAADVAHYKGGVVVASGLDDALSKLSGGAINKADDGTGPAGDKHPEKRMKAAYAAYEELYFPALKAEHPTLKFTQIKDLLWKARASHAQAHRPPARSLRR
jgi:hypothetical protein